MNHLLPMILLVAAFGLSACHPHYSKPHPGHPHGKHFCPPGQAKKGNCH